MQQRHSEGDAQKDGVPLQQHALELVALALADRAHRLLRHASQHVGVSGQGLKGYGLKVRGLWIRYYGLGDQPLHPANANSTHRLLPHTPHDRGSMP